MKSNHRLKVGLFPLKVKALYRYIPIDCFWMDLWMSSIPRLVEESRLKRDKALPEWASTSTPRHVERVDVFGTAHSSLCCKSSHRTECSSNFMEGKQRLNYGKFCWYLMEVWCFYVEEYTLE